MIPRISPYVKNVTDYCLNLFHVVSFRLQELLLLLKTLGACERGQSSASAKEGAAPWKSLQTGAFAILEALQSLLSTPSFVAVIHELLLHEVGHPQRRR